MYRNLKLNDLIEAGITEITKDGRVFKDKEELSIIKIKSGYKGKYYLAFNIYDIDENGDRLKIYDTEKHYSYKVRTICLHRAVYLWNKNKEDKDFTELSGKLDIDHINNDPNNNNYNNLQILTREENLAKDRKPAKYKAKMPKKKIYTEDYIKYKIDSHYSRIEYLRSIKTEENRKQIAKEIHKVRASVAQWKNRLKQFKGE